MFTDSPGIVQRVALNNEGLMAPRGQLRPNERRLSVCIPRTGGQK